MCYKSQHCWITTLGPQHADLWKMLDLENHELPGSKCLLSQLSTTRKLSLLTATCWQLLVILFLCRLVGKKKKKKKKKKKTSVDPTLSPPQNTHPISWLPGIGTFPALTRNKNCEPSSTGVAPGGFWRWNGFKNTNWTKPTESSGSKNVKKKGTKTIVK